MRIQPAMPERSPGTLSSLSLIMMIIIIAVYFIVEQLENIHNGNLDFPISENESIRLLWLWFCFIEKIKDKSSKNNLPISNEIQFEELVNIT